VYRPRAATRASDASAASSSVASRKKWRLASPPRGVSRIPTGQGWRDTSRRSSSMKPPRPSSMITSTWRPRGRSVSSASSQTSTAVTGSGPHAQSAHVAIKIRPRATAAV
jgi:hypothetical protein